MVSCSLGKAISPAKTNISGPLGAYFKVVDRPCSIRNGVINVEIKRTRAGLPEPWTLGMDYAAFSPGFYIDVMNKNNDVLAKDKTDINADKYELKSLMALAVGESTTISFHLTGNLLGAASFKIGSNFDGATSSATRLPGAFFCPDYIRVTGDNVRVRCGPGLHYDPITDIYGKNIHPLKGEILKCIGESDDFYKIRYCGQNMFITKQYTEPSNATNATYSPEESYHIYYR